jgi:hypothetical protein
MIKRHEKKLSDLINNQNDLYSRIEYSHYYRIITEDWIPFDEWKKGMERLRSTKMV